MITDGIIIALIALGGTLITVFVGYRQWKGQQNTSHSDAYVRNRVEIYKQLWGFIPDLSNLANYRIRFRNLLPSKEKIENSTNEIQKFILKNDLFIDDVDVRVINRYLYDLKCASDEHSKFLTTVETPVVDQEWLNSIKESLDNYNADSPPADEEIADFKKSIRDSEKISRAREIKIWFLSRILKNPNSFNLIFVGLFIPREKPVIAWLRAIHILSKSRTKLISRFKKVLSGQFPQ